MPKLGHVDRITHQDTVGWVMDPARPNAALDVRIIVDGQEHGDCVANISRPDLARDLPQPSTGAYGFNYRFDPPLTATRTHTIEVIVLPEKEVITNGRRTLYALSYGRMPLQPLLITSSGRAGTTSLMQDFIRQPAIAVADNYPFETKLAAYYAATLRAMTMPKYEVGEEVLEVLSATHEQGHVVSNPFNAPGLHQALGGEPLVRLFRDSIPERLAGTLRGIVLDIYGQIASHQGKTQARFFAEKGILNEDSRQNIRWAFGHIREIVLVRDPRDYLCSAKAFWKFNSKDALQVMRTEIPLLERIENQRQSDVLFVRYEDFIRDPIESRSRIYSFIGLEPWEIEPLEGEATIIQGHATTSSPRASIGRWKTDLSPEEAETCRTLFASYIERFNYDPN